MSFAKFTFVRRISTSAVREGKRNFRKFLLHNKRGTRIFKEQQKENADPDLPIDKRGVRDVGYTLHGKFVTVLEMIPELIVPNLKDFKLKPYISYRAPDVVQPEFTSEDLFNVVYAAKIVKDFREGNLKEPSEEEELTPNKVKLNANQTGSDMLGSFCNEVERYF